MAGTIDVVVLVGLGNIGFRHLQGLSRAYRRIALWGIDPDPAALDRAAAEWNANGQLATGFIARLQDLKGRSDVAILATSAKGRLPLMDAVIATAAPRYVILEKVAFQSASDMRVADALARRSGTSVFVNCPRRLWPLYRTLRKQIDGRPFALSVRGRDLGLACNGIHFVDLLQFLAGDQNVSLETAGFENIVASKRSGFYECLGRMQFRTSNGCTLDLSVRNDDPAPIAIEIAFGNGDTFAIDETRGSMTSPGQSLIVDIGRSPYQSELTGLVVDQLLEAGACGLATLAESTAAHEPFLGALGTHFSAKGFDISDAVPIT